MAKFNQPAPARTPDATTAEGGSGFSRSIKDELFTLGLANMVGEDTFYETADVRDKRFENLIHEVTKADETWARAFIGWLRSEGNMRSAPIVAAAEYVRAGGSGGRRVVTSALQRPDEPGELLGYWLNRYGRKVPQPIKRGIADALPRLYTERNALRYDGQGKAIRFGDVIELVHPSPLDTRQSDLYRYLIDRRHGREDRIAGSLPIIIEDARLMALSADQRRANLGAAIANGWSWERLAGWLPGGMDAEAWEAVIPNMGLMALTRNLRNFDKAGLSDRTVHAVTGRFLEPEEVRKSRQFPLRFLTAWRATSSMRWGMALEVALNLSLDNVPALPGRTLVLIDTSGSMQDFALSRRTDSRVDYSITPRRWEVAATFGAAVAQRAEQADVVLFNTEPVSTVTVARADSVLRFVEQCGQWANKGGGTDILRTLAHTFDHHDRVVILTDEQQGYPNQPFSHGATYGWQYASMGYRGAWSDVAHIKAPVYTFNLGGFKVGVTPNERNWHTFGGLTDACFRLIPILEHRRAGLWPWDVPSAPTSSPLD